MHRSSQGPASGSSSLLGGVPVYWLLGWRSPVQLYGILPFPHSAPCTHQGRTSPGMAQGFLPTLCLGTFWLPPTIAPSGCFAGAKKESFILATDGL